ncbi:MAG: hypothetical protein OHK0017_01490 [Patescibacteria group bacterium]
MSNHKGSKKSEVKEEKKATATEAKNEIVDSKAAEITDSKTTVENKEKAVKKTKKSGFLGRTLDELKLVSWPKLGYTVRWSLIIIMFTIFLGATLGFVDYYAASAINFVDCTSPKGRGQEVSKCLQDLTKELTFQEYLNRSTVTNQDQNTTDQTQDGNTNLQISEPTTETPNENK